MNNKKWCRRFCYIVLLKFRIYIFLRNYHKIPHAPTAVWRSKCVCSWHTHVACHHLIQRDWNRWKISVDHKHDLEAPSKPMFSRSLILAVESRARLDTQTVRSASQDTFWLLHKPNVHYRAHNSPPPVYVLSQMNPIHTIPKYFTKTNFYARLNTAILWTPQKFPNRRWRRDEVGVQLAT
jgi:hypothetical protein